jgi:hypothetical protein
MLAAGPELRITGAAAQTRMVSVARIRLGSCESARAFKGIICDDVSEFESYMPSHSVGLSQVLSPRNRHAQAICLLGRFARIDGTARELADGSVHATEVP